MKKKLCFALVLCLLLGALSVCAAAADVSLRVLTLNMLNDDTRSKRFDAIKGTVSEVNADIVGLQEARETFDTVKAYIKENGYASAVDTLIDDPLSKTIVNCVPIYYKTDRFELVEGSAGARRFTEKYNDSWTKAMTYCVLREKASGEMFIVMNAHYAVLTGSMDVDETASGAAWRVSNSEEFLAQIAAMRAKYGDLPIITTGDYNMIETTKAYRMLMAELTDCYHIADEAEPYAATLHPATYWYPIDHIFVTGDDFHVHCVKKHETENGLAASDHYPVYADLTLTKDANPTFPCKAAHTSKAPLMIVDATRRTPYADALEGFTVMNVSDKPIDLSHILVWYRTAKSQGDLETADPESVTMTMRLWAKRGEKILDPGEKAYIWCISSAAYKNAATLSGGSAFLVDQGADGKPNYREADFRDASALFDANLYQTQKIEDSTMLIPLDRTNRLAFGTDGSYKNLDQSFNLQNTVYIRLYLTYDDAKSASDAFCCADLDGTGDGTYIKSDDSIAVNYGTYLYEPTGEAHMKTASFEKNAFPFGHLTDARKALFDAVDAEAVTTGLVKVYKTIVKLTIGSATGFVNDAAKTLDAAPVIRNARTMLPVRFVAEAFGAEVGWDPMKSLATVKTTDTEIGITIGSPTASVNGKKVALDSPAFIENGRTYLPVRFVAEALGAEVEWDAATSTATLKK